MDRKIYAYVKEKYPKLKTWGMLRFGAHYRGERLVPWGVWFRNMLLMTSDETRELMGDEYIEYLEKEYKKFLKRKRKK